MRWFAGFGCWDGFLGYLLFNSMTSLDFSEGDIFLFHTCGFFEKRTGREGGGGVAGSSLGF